jgi:hypothetical protein
MTAEEIQVLLRATWSGPNPERDEALIYALVSGVRGILGSMPTDLLPTNLLAVKLEETSW